MDMEEKSFNPSLINSISDSYVSPAGVTAGYVSVESVFWGYFGHQLPLPGISVYSTTIVGKNVFHPF